MHHATVSMIAAGLAAMSVAAPGHAAPVTGAERLALGAPMQTGLGRTAKVLEAERTRTLQKLEAELWNERLRAAAEYERARDRGEEARAYEVFIERVEKIEDRFAEEFRRVDAIYDLTTSKRRLIGRE